VAFGTEIFVILALILINGFFAGAEIALLSVRRTRLQELADSGKGAARKALQLRDDPEQFLATVQVGITFVGATAGAFGGATLAEPLTRWLAGVGAGHYADGLGLTIVVVFISVLSIVLGELVPKSLALRASERISLLVARPLHALARVSRPLVWVLTSLSNLVLRPFQDQTTFTEARLSPEELQSLVEQASTAGSLSASVGDIASRALELQQLPVNAVLIPRRQIVAIKLGATRDEVWATLKAQPHGRYPVIADDLDSIEGYVTTRDLVTQIVETGSVDVRKAMREIAAFIEQTTAIEVLRALQKQRTPLAVVVDEHGMTSGIVTITDIAQELVGDILDEHERPSQSVRLESEGVWLVRSDTTIQDLNRALGTSFAVSTDYATLSGLVMHASSRIMSRGETITIGDSELEVVDATARQVKLVRVRLARDEPKPDE